MENLSRYYANKSLKLGLLLSCRWDYWRRMIACCNFHFSYNVNQGKWYIFMYEISSAIYCGAASTGPLEPQLACKATETDHYKAN